MKAADLKPIVIDRESVDLIFARLAAMPYGLDDLIRDNGPAAVWAWIVQPASRWMWIMGHEEPGGLLGAYSIIPDRQTDVHISVWDRELLGRECVIPAALTGLAFLVHEYNVHRVQATIPARNSHARLLARRLGFTEEGRLYDAFKFRGVFTDGVGCAILQDEIIQGLHSFKEQEP